MIKVIMGFIIITILFSCNYTDSAIVSGKDMITNLNLTTDWTAEKGILIATSAVTPPSGEAMAYKLSLPNLVSNGDFESDANGTTTPASWTKVAPNQCVVQNTPANQITGSQYLYVKLLESSNQYIYSAFASEASVNYTFKFNYRFMFDVIRVSMGPAGSDARYDIWNASLYDHSNPVTASFDFPCSVTDPAYQIRFGSVTAYNNAYITEINVDHVALFPNSNHNINKSINISGSGQPVISDGTGETFLEGVYEFKLYARVPVSGDPAPDLNDPGVPNNACLIIGSKYKDFTLTTYWQEISIQAQVLKSAGYLVLKILPVPFNQSNRYPENIYITKPKLIYLPNQATPN